MFEREGLSVSQETELEKRFDVSMEYWKDMVSKGLVERSTFFNEVFDSNQTEIYREMVNGDDLFYIAKTLNETRKSRNSEGRKDTLPNNLPTSAPATSTSPSGGTT